MLEHDVLRRGEIGGVGLESVRLVQKEILKIRSTDIAWFTSSSLPEVDRKFWTAPASSSGKFHPPEDNGEGGLVRHVIKGVAVIEQFARRAMFSERESDMAISAFLLHDTCKDGVVWTGKTDLTHGLIAARWLEQFELADKTAKAEIQRAVRFHMSPWCYAVNPFEDRSYTKEEMQANLEEMKGAMFPGRIELAIREADYWASRGEMSFLPGKTIMFDGRRHDTPEEWLAQLTSPYSA